MSGYPMVLLVLILSAMLFSLNGCASEKQTRVVDTGCAWVQPLLVTVDVNHDTAETIREALALKNAYVKNCVAKK